MNGLKIATMGAGGVFALAAGLFGRFCYKNLHWYDIYEKNLKKVKAEEKQVTLPSGRVINYGEVKNEKPALLLIHGQMGIWEDYALVLPKLSEKWHIFAIDVYGHGESTHEEDLYYIDVNGDDMIWFIDHVIGEKTVVAGHSNGALTAAYIAANGGANVAGAVLEDPPVFSTDGEDWEKSFAYLDTYRTLHQYDQSDKSLCWEAFYLKHCYWGELFMKNAMDGISKAAQKIHEKHPEDYVKLPWLPSSIWYVFRFAKQYDFAYGEHFYDLSWNNGIRQEDTLRKINIPCVYLHAKENVHENGTFLCAASKEQANCAAALIGESCRLVETPTSDHVIHSVHSDLYIEAVNSLLDE